MRGDTYIVYLCNSDRKSSNKPHSYYTPSSNYSSKREVEVETNSPPPWNIGGFTVKVIVLVHTWVSSYDYEAQYTLNPLIVFIHTKRGHSTILIPYALFPRSGVILTKADTEYARRSVSPPILRHCGPCRLRRCDAALATVRYRKIRNRDPTGIELQYPPE